MHPGHLTHSTDQTPLFFCYNRRQKDIVYTNQSPVIFFGSAITNWDESILFRSPEWLDCLRLTAGKSLSFVATEAGARFFCQATAVDVTGGTGPEPLLMCTVEKEHQPPKDLSKEYEEFVHLAAHDLDAPLRKLTMLMERLSAKMDGNGPGAEYLPRISSNLADMRAMVDGLSKLAESYQAVEPQQVVLDDVVREVIETLAKKYAGREITVDVEHLPVIQGDRGNYYSLFHHLLENALLFSKKEMPVSVYISVAEATQEEKGKHALQRGTLFYKISIRDKGTGFNQDDAEKIFQPFVRLHGKSEYPGSGMGLAICKRIVERNGGVIYGEGIENEGAGIILFLPQSLN